MMGIPADDQQAHAMSHPAAEQAGRRHVSEEAFAAINAAGIPNVHWAESTCKISGTVLLTVAEHEADQQQIAKLLNAHKTMDKEIVALRAEVERLTDKFRCKQFEADMMADVLHEQDRIIERLRKGREDDENGTAAAVGNVRSAVRVPGAQGILATADTLDPRLGIQQPEGEPGQPMPYWRRRMGD